MSNSVPLGGSSAYNSYNAAAFAAQFAARTAAAAAAAASKPKDPQQPKPAKQVVNDEDEIADDVAEYDNFANVSTADLETLGLIEHPSPACEAASLSSVPSPDCDYTVKLPSKMLQTGAISALQFQAVRLACARHELRLPGGERAGFFLGDGPGVGKGRQIAATIFNYFCRGKTKALWVSVSGDLVVDARRDIDALGMLDYDAVRLHDLRTLKPKKDQKLSDLPGMDKGIAFCTYDLLVSGATRKPKKTKAKKGKAWSGLGLNMSFEEEEEEPEEFGPTSRLSQICEWLSDGDYVVVFDECHKAKNCITKESNVFPIQTEEQQEGFGGNSFGEGAAKDGMKRVQGSSKTSRAVVELQRRLPDARILYVSATGASEAENLCYMERLGLWGPGAAFPNKKEFVALLKQGGMGALELVAMELKGAGAFVSRALSWTGVRFETVAIDASPEFLEMYNAAVDVWQDTRQFMDAHCPGSSRLRTMAQFYAAQLRFFRQLCTAAKVDTVVELCLQALAAGQCPVIGLQSTGEARTAAYVKAAQTNKEREGSYDGEEAGQGEFDSFVEPAGLILSSFIEKHLMEGGGAEDLLERAKSLVLPKNPLDDLIKRLGGPDAVAEMTGRQKRMEKQPKGGYSYISRAAQYGRCSLDDVNILERNAFQTGSKRVAIISDAASAGISLHADKGTANQAQRVHITLELAWSADATVQQLGRTHRSNQVSCPIYKIVSSNICGEHRFASAVAHRLQQLGALTQGDRRAASASEAMAGFNLQTLWARTALRLLVDLIVTGGAAQAARDDRVETFASLDPPFLEEMMREGLPEDQDPPLPGTNSYAIRRKAAMIRWCDAAQSQLSAVGLLNGKSLTTNKLLNRLLGMHVEMQGQIFGYFSTILDKVVADAKREGRYDATGIIKPGCESIEFKETTELIQHPNGAAPTCHTEFAVDRGCPWEKAKKLLDEELERVRAAQGETAMQQCGAGFYFTDSATTRYVILALPKSDKGSKSVRVRGVAFDRAKYFKIVRPATGCTYEKSWGDLHLGYTRINNPSVAEREWRSYWGSAAGQKLRMQPLHLLTGSVLPLLPAIQKVAERHRGFGGRVQRLKLMRVETSGANMQRFIGLHVPDVMLKTMVDRITGLSDLTPEERLQRNQQKKQAAAAAAAAAASKLFKAAPGAAPAAAGGGSSSAAAAGSSDVPEGLADDVRRMLQEAAAAVDSSNKLISGPAAAAGAEAEQANDGECDDSSSEGNAEGPDPEAAAPKQPRKKRARRGPVDAAGEARAALVRAAAAAMAAAAAAGSSRGAAAPVVTEGLAAAGLWEEGDGELQIRPGGAAAAGGGGTKWQRFAGKGGGGCGGGGRGGGGGSGGRGRGRAKKFIVSDDEDDLVNDDSSSEDYADVNSGVDDSDADDVILGESDGEDDGSAHKQSSRGKGDRGSSGRAQARMASLKRAAAVTAAAKVAAATAGYEEGEESEEDSDSPTAAAGVHVEDLGDIDPAMAAAMPGFQFKAAAAAAAAAGDKDADDDCVIEDEDEIMGVNELPAFKRAAKKRKGSAAAADAAGEDFVIDLSQDDDPQPSAAADPEPAAVVGKKRGRKSKAAAPAGKAAAADDDVVITVSSRGRVRKVKKLADFYVDPTEVEGPASQPAAAAAAAEPESEQQHSEQHEEAEEPAEAEAAADEADAPASPAAASGSPAAATTAAEGPQDHDMDNAAAAAADMAEQQQEAPEEPDAEGSTAAAAAAGAGDEDMADAAAEVAEQQQEQAAQPAASEGRAATAATAGGATASPVKASKQPAEPAAAVDAQPDEAAIKSRVLELLSSQPPGSTLSVKAIRLAVQSATGWVLASAADKAAVKAACHAFVEQQQQQQEEVVGSNPAPGAVFAKDAQAGLKAAVAQVLAEPGAADKSMRIVRDEVAALLGLTALQAKEHRDSIKQLVRAQLGAQGAAEAAAADGAAAAAAGKEEEARSAGSSHSQGQQNEAAAAATAGEASDCVEEEEILGVDELPEFRPRKAAAGRNCSKKSTSKAGCKQQSAAAAPAENEDEGGKHSLSGEDLDAFVVEGEDRECDRGTRARSSSKHSSSSSKKRGRSSKQQQSEADAAAAAATAAGDKEEEEGAGEVTAPTAAAAAAACPSSKRQRLHRSAAAAGLEDFEVPMPDVDVDASLEDPNLLDALMDELTSPAADASPAAAADGPAAAAVGSGAKAADGQGGSPVPADMFDDTPSPQGLRKAGSASSTGTTAVVQVPAWGLRKKRSGLSATAAAAAEGTADAAGTGQAGRGHGAGGHRRARVIADSDDEGDGEQHQGPVAADTAAAAAELAELKQQLAAVLAQVAELQKAQANSPPQQQEQQQQQGPTEVAAAAAAQESLQQQLVQLQQQREVEAAAKAAAESEAARLREERAALQKQLCQQQQDEAAAAAEGAKVAQLQAELEALKQQQQQEAECAAVAKQTAAAAVAAAQKAEVEDRLAQLLQQQKQQQQEMAAVYEQQQEQRATAEQLLAAEAEREGLTAQLAALKQQHETELAALKERLAAAEAAAESPRFAVPAPAFTAAVDGTPMGKGTAAFGTGEAAAGATVSKQENLTPITPGTAPEAAAAAAEPGAADGSSAKNSLAGSFPGFGSPMGAKTCGFPVFAKPLAVTLDDVRACLGDYPSGVTAVQLLQAFGASSSSSTSSKSLVEVLCAHLQCLVDDVEVIRKGGKAACSSKVDMDDAATLFIPLC